MSGKNEIEKKRLFEFSAFHREQKHCEQFVFFWEWNFSNTVFPIQFSRKHVENFETFQTTACMEAMVWVFHRFPCILLC